MSSLDWQRGWFSMTNEGIEHRHEVLVASADCLLIHRDGDQSLKMDIRSLPTLVEDIECRCHFARTTRWGESTPLDSLSRSFHRNVWDGRCISHVKPICGVICTISFITHATVSTLINNSLMSNVRIWSSAILLRTTLLIAQSKHPIHLNECLDDRTSLRDIISACSQHQGERVSEIASAKLVPNLKFLRRNLLQSFSWLIFLFSQVQNYALDRTTGVSNQNIEQTASFITFSFGWNRRMILGWVW